MTVVLAKLDPKEWHEISEWSVKESEPGFFMARIGRAVSQPRLQVAYSDKNVNFTVYMSGKKTVLGYTLQCKTDHLKPLLRPWYMSLIDMAVAEHSAPKVVYSDSHVYLRRFNKPSHYSYWLALRNRTT